MRGYRSKKKDDAFLFLFYFAAVKTASLKEEVHILH